VVHITVPVEPRIDDRGEPIRLRPLDRRHAPKARRRRERSTLPTLSREMLKWRAAARLLMPSAQARRTFR
jgi:hypothetical protein